MSAEAWLALRTRVLADPALTAELWRLTDAAAFRTRLNELGAPALGSWPWDGGPLMLPSPLQPPPLAKPPPGPGWTIARLDAFAPTPWLHWRQTGEQAPREPFYASDLNRFLAVRTPLAALEAPAMAAEPAGLVLHMSRCGSTLVSRMLGQIEGVVALSEPPIVGELLRARRFNPGLGEPEIAGWLRAAVAALVGAAGGGQAVVKLEAGGMLHLRLLRQAFPRTPWIFLHRDPVEVMLSQARERSSEMLPGVIEAVLPLPADLPPDEACARTLGAICEAAAEALDDAGLAVAYDTLPDAVETRIAPHFGLALDGAARARMAEVATRSARRGDLPFVPRQEDADDAIRALAGRWVAPPLARLRQRA
jgi:hypothetical protein